MFHIHERFLRHIWGKQYLVPLELQTRNGLSLEIVSPGIPNPDAGPDYLDAKIRIDGKAYSGDVELHKCSSDWIRHRHSADRRYNSVILHVVLYGDDTDPVCTESGRLLPELCLQRFLDDSFRVIWDRSIADDRNERSRSLPCTTARPNMPPGEVFQWIGHLAYERLELKIRRFDGRLKEIIDEHRLAVREPRLRYYGDIDQIPAPNPEYTLHDFSPGRFWDQVLYEGIFEALGYSKNREPFLKLARNVTLDFLRENIVSPQTDARLLLRAIFSGAAGFLDEMKPETETGEAEGREKLCEMWESVAPAYRKERLQRAEWTYFRLRPNNFPDRRLEAGVVIVERILNEALLKKIVEVLKSGEKPAAMIRTLRSYFIVGTQESTALLGRSRVDEMIVNTVLPLASLYARIFRETEIREAVKDIYAWYPQGMENGCTRFVRKSVPGIDRSHRGALVQQGMLHLFNFYCTEKRCADCRIGQFIARNEAD